jgi:hypothetical protein
MYSVCVCAFFCRPVSWTSGCPTDTSAPSLVVYGLLRVNFTFVNLPINRDCRIIQLRKKKSFYCRARLFINLGSRWGLGFRRHTPAALLHGKDTRYTLYRRLGGPRAGPDWYGKSCPYGIRSSDLPARTESLYRLSYPGAQINNLISGNRFRPDMPDKTIFLLCYENPTSSSRVVSCGRTVGQTGMTRVIVAFRHFAYAPKNWLHTYIHTHTPRIC